MSSADRPQSVGRRGKQICLQILRASPTAHPFADKFPWTHKKANLPLTRLTPKICRLNRHEFSSHSTAAENTAFHTRPATSHWPLIKQLHSADFMRLSNWLISLTGLFKARSSGMQIHASCTIIFPVDRLDQLTAIPSGVRPGRRSNAGPVTRPVRGIDSRCRYRSFEGSQSTKPDLYETQADFMKKRSISWLASGPLSSL
jgi:hypothetical protein